MDRNDIIRMAQECNLIGMRPHLDGIYEKSLECFAVLVAAAEREKFVAECIDLVAMYGGSVDLEAAIRARGNHANG